MTDKHEFIGWFYYDKAGHRIGPITTDALKALVADGTLQPASVVTKAFYDGGQKHVYLCRVSDALRQFDFPTHNGNG